MDVAVNSEMASLAGCYHVVGVGADWLAGAQVGYGEADGAICPACGLVVDL